MNNRFELYYPLKPKFVSQPFGVNGNYYQTMGIDIIGHNGVDFVAKHGQPVYAPHDGTAYYEIDNKGGCGVIIRTNENFEYNGELVFFKSILWHLCDGNKEPKYKSPITFTNINGAGQPVKAGDLIGYADNTGLSTGDHLHFGLKPQAKTESYGMWYNTEQTNGYLGCIDPTPFFNGKYAEDIKTLQAIQDQAIAAVSQTVELIKNDTIDTPQQRSKWLQILYDFLDWIKGR